VGLLVGEFVGTGVGAAVGQLPPKGLQDS